MSTSVQVFILACCIAGLIGFAYSWFFLLKVSGQNSLRWRDWVSLAAVGLASVAVFLRFVMPALMPSADWGTGVGVGEQVHFVQAWTKVSVRICAVALVMALLGRPRLILPIVVACFGTGLFWVMSTVP